MAGGGGIEWEEEEMGMKWEVVHTRTFPFHIYPLVLSFLSLSFLYHIELCILFSLPLHTDTEKKMEQRSSSFFAIILKSDTAIAIGRNQTEEKNVDSKTTGSYPPDRACSSYRASIAFSS